MFARKSVEYKPEVLKLNNQMNKFDFLNKALKVEQESEPN